ncbi:DUF6225 family protein [Streptomyces sp. SP18CS02]|uniref:DUF6225 family protein n=1 Tax=Streptomyces sp. SP18CS02 TaxID=3002531 RepID=UPI002E760D0B|nr:DUF6225 family protein [Streptomyces sp. SP18CS02]MEE1754766.1 DUF6225 family protein [Streptomyces sp. SP18CS02]
MNETFDHAPEAWTAGRLRDALKDLSDDTVIHIGVADEPNDFDTYHEYTLVDAEPVEKERPVTEDGTERYEVEFTLFADYKAGTYDRVDD